MRKDYLLFYDLKFAPVDLDFIEQRAKKLWLERRDSQNAACWAEAVMEELAKRGVIKVDDATYYSNGQKRRGGPNE